MSDIEGKWAIVIASPIGPQEGTVEVHLDGAELTGTATAMGQSMEIQEARAEGQQFWFSIDMERPMPMHMAFELFANGDDLGGGVVAGPFGRLEVTGNRL